MMLGYHHDAETTKTEVVNPEVIKWINDHLKDDPTDAVRLVREAEQNPRAEFEDTKRSPENPSQFPVHLSSKAKEMTNTLQNLETLLVGYTRMLKSCFRKLNLLPTHCMILYSFGKKLTLVMTENANWVLFKKLCRGSTKCWKPKITLLFLRLLKN